MISIENDQTIKYYNIHASEYFDVTVGADMSDVYNRFLKYVKPGGTIVDIGSGSGRDTLYFKNSGYTVDAIDGSIELCRMASEYTGVSVKCCKIQDWSPQKAYDGIWANASLLHLHIDEFKRFLDQLVRENILNGYLYFSIKHEGNHVNKELEERYYLELDYQQIKEIIGQFNALNIVEYWETTDKINRRGIVWDNYIIQGGY